MVIFVICQSHVTTRYIYCASWNSSNCKCEKFCFASVDHWSPRTSCSERHFAIQFLRNSIFKIPKFANATQNGVPLSVVSKARPNEFLIPTNGRQRGRSSSTKCRGRRRWSSWWPGRIQTNCQAVPRTRTRRWTIGVVTRVITRWPSITRAARAKWDRPVTKWRWWTRGWGSTASRGFEWSTRRSCRWSFRGTRTHRPLWSLRRLLTWSRRTGRSKTTREIIYCYRLGES